MARVQLETIHLLLQLNRGDNMAVILDTAIYTIIVALSSYYILNTLFLFLGFPLLAKRFYSLYID
jgi:hypothetical protein